MTSALNSCIVGIFDMTDRHILHGKKCPLELALAIQWNEAVFPPILCYQWFFVICAQRESFSTSNTFSSSFPFCVLLIKTRSDKRQTTKVHGSSDVDRSIYTHCVLLFPDIKTLIITLKCAFDKNCCVHCSSKWSYVVLFTFFRLLNKKKVPTNSSIYLRTSKRHKYFVQSSLSNRCHLNGS